MTSDIALLRLSRTHPVDQRHPSEATIEIFDTSMRGYRRSQVDEYLAKLQRVMSRVESDLEFARRRTTVGDRPPGATHDAARARDTVRRGNKQDLSREQIDLPLTERMDAILQAARMEAADIRRRAHEAAEAERARALSEMDRLVGQRDLVLADLLFMRRQIEEMLPTPPPRSSPPAVRAVEATTAIPAARTPGRKAPAPATQRAADVEATLKYRPAAGKPEKSG